jgi:hypothetical protein
MFFLFFVPVSVLNSLCNFVSRRFRNIVYREGVNHILIGMNITPKKFWFS